MRLYNTLTRQQESFAPAHGRTVRMYACGLTVYARGHIGNFRTFVALDVLRRTLRHVAGFDMQQVVNFTDVDDKTIAAARKAGEPLRTYTDRYIAAFREDAQALGIETAEAYPRATDEPNLRAMVDMVAALEARGHAYRSDGSVYFRIATDPRLWPSGAARPRRHPARRPDQHRPVRQAGRARLRVVEGVRSGRAGLGLRRGSGPAPAGTSSAPPWRLRLLGAPPIDIHAGGVDLIFPHHENEIAQAEGATGAPFARFWVHVEHLLIDRGDKMSKSEGNVLSVQECPAARPAGFGAAVPVAVDPTTASSSLHVGRLAQAEEALTRLMDCLARLDTLPAGAPHAAVTSRADAARAAFAAMLESDLNTPGRSVWCSKLVRDVHAAIDAGDVAAGDAAALRATVRLLRPGARRCRSAPRGRGRAAHPRSPRSSG